MLIFCPEKLYIIPCSLPQKADAKAKKRANAKNAFAL